MPTRSNRARAAVQATVLAGAALGFMTACGSDNVDAEAHCVDENNVRVDDDLCDTDNGHGGGGGFFFLMMNSGHSYPVGTAIPEADRRGSYRVAANDPAARTKAGLAPAGRVASGTKIAGGIGKGGGAPKGGIGGSKGSSGGG